jgi:hypothetical protein
MQTSHLDYTQSTAPLQATIYCVGRSWYAKNVTWSRYPATMRILGIDASQANALYPFSTRAKAKAALLKAQQSTPQQTVKWPVRTWALDVRSVSTFRFGTLQKTRGDYAIVATSIGRTERVRLARLIMVEKQEGVTAAHWQQCLVETQRIPSEWYKNDEVTMGKRRRAICSD